MDKRKPKETHGHMRRAFSDTDLIKSESRFPGGSRRFPAGIREEEHASDGDIDREFQTLVKGNGSDRASFAPIWSDFISNDKTGFPCDAFGNGGKSGCDNGDDSFGGKRHGKSGGILRKSDLSQSWRWRAWFWDRTRTLCGKQRKMKKKRKWVIKLELRQRWLLPFNHLSLLSTMEDPSA
ncbi:hypothetical protein DITRI_Ditri07aG0171100 [Diplodiscus trichospermus]